MGQVRWTSEAHRWLREIHDYIALDNPAAAQRVARGIHAQAKTLVRFPERGYLHESRTGEAIRILLYGHYRIAYRLSPTRDIEILGVFHGALDIERFLPPSDQT